MNFYKLIFVCNEIYDEDNYTENNIASLLDEYSTAKYF
jgi:hypothetical protein